MDDISRFFSGSVPMTNLAFPPMTPQLVILSQKTHSEESVSKNGIQRTVHVVVKNSPFHIILGMAGTSTFQIDFNRIAFDANLVYDCDGGKEVDYVQKKPVQYKFTPIENGAQLDCEFRINILTSHHEDMLFKVKIQGFNPLTKEEINGLALLTFPIKVISKPEHLKKRQPSKKRTLTDMLVETVSRIEKKQEEQQRLLEKMFSQQATVPSATAAALEKRQKTIDQSIAAAMSQTQSYWEQLPAAESATSSSSTSSKDGKKEVPDFEDAFGYLVKSYNALTGEEKAETIRKMIRTSSTRDTERLSELLDLFWTEGLQKEPSFGSKPSARERAAKDNANSNTVTSPSNGQSSNEGCICNSCPHKLELERIDEFYKEFLQTGVSNMPPF